MYSGSVVFPMKHTIYHNFHMQSLFPDGKLQKKGRVLCFAAGLHGDKERRAQ